MMVGVMADACVVVDGPMLSGRVGSGRACGVGGLVCAVPAGGVRGPRGVCPVAAHSIELLLVLGVIGSYTHTTRTGRYECIVTRRLAQSATGTCQKTCANFARTSVSSEQGLLRDFCAFFPGTTFSFLAFEVLH